VTVHIGFTGTRAGMTPEQQTRVSLLLLELGATDLDHGDCIGADDQADQIGRELGLGIFIHPPTNPKLRAWCNTRPHGEITVLEEFPFLVRNQHIADAGDEVVAAPKEMTEERRSGTWWTVRYARGKRRPVHIVWPNGAVTTEKGGPYVRHRDNDATRLPCG
jgi:hypothetical protein